MRNVWLCGDAAGHHLRHAPASHGDGRAHKERFAGLIARYKTGNPAVIGATLDTLEGILLNCDSLRHNIDAGGVVLSVCQGANKAPNVPYD